MLLMTVVLPLKRGGDYRGIGLLEPFWKMVEVLMDKRLQVIQFHEGLHRFLTGRGTGTATIQAKLAQQLVYLHEEVLHEVFFDLKKAYDVMDRERCMKILEGYEVGPRMLRLVKFFGIKQY